MGNGGLGKRGQDNGPKKDKWDQSSDRGADIRNPPTVKWQNQMYTNKDNSDSLLTTHSTVKYLRIGGKLNESGSQKLG